MRIGMGLNYAGSGFKDTVEELADFEKAGLDIVYVPEAYSFDAVSQMGYIAAKTERLEIGSGILNIYSRTPTAIAQTAAGLDYVSDGRFTLGIGASGPQVIEGFHGVPYTAPLGRTREIIEICRKVWRRERVQHEGRHYTLPLPPERGTGLGKALKLINHPVRAEIPIMVAAIGHEPDLKHHHDLLLANCLAQSEALMKGRTLEEARAQMLAKGQKPDFVDRIAPQRVFAGNRPSITLVYRELDPRMLGRLIALYEHRVFVEGVLYDINSFDQWGVELGKELATSLLPVVEGKESAAGRDASTAGLVEHIHRLRGE